MASTARQNHFGELRSNLIPPRGGSPANKEKKTPNSHFETPRSQGLQAIRTWGLKKMLFVLFRSYSYLFVLFCIIFGEMSLHLYFFWMTLPPLVHFLGKEMAIHTNVAQKKHDTHEWSRGSCIIAYSLIPPPPQRSNGLELQ